MMPRDFCSEHKTTWPHFCMYGLGADRKKPELEDLYEKLTDIENALALLKSDIRKLTVRPRTGKAQVEMGGRWSKTG